MILQLDPTIPLDTPRGPGQAHFLLDYGREHHLVWVVFLDDSGECWSYPNPLVRLRPNETADTRTAPRAGPG